MARLREGRANTTRGAAHFLRETVARVRDAGASGQLTMRADSGFYNHAVVAACRALDVRFSVTIRQQPNVRTLIEAIPEADWTPIPYWLPGGAAVAETTYTPFQHMGDASAVRLIVRRVQPTPGSQLALFATYSYHAFITDRAGEMMELEADHRRHAEIENAIRDLKYGVGLNHLPSGPLRRQRGVARGAGDRTQPGSLDGAAGARRGDRHDQDAQAALLCPRRTAHPFRPALDPAPPDALALGRATGSRARATTGATAPGLTPGSQRRPGSEPRASTPAHASRTPAPVPSAPQSCAERRLLAPAPPGERRRTRRTLRQPGIPPPQASIGASGVTHAPHAHRRQATGPHSMAAERAWSAACATVKMPSAAAAALAGPGSGAGRVTVCGESTSGSLARCGARAGGRG